MKHKRGAILHTPPVIRPQVMTASSSGRWARTPRLLLNSQVPRGIVKLKHSFSRPVRSKTAGRSEAILIPCEPAVVAPPRSAKLSQGASRNNHFGFSPARPLGVPASATRSGACHGLLIRDPFSSSGFHAVVSATTLLKRAFSPSSRSCRTSSLALRSSKTRHAEPSSY
jgi:hypothetical protein